MADTDLAQRLVTATENALARHLGGYGEPGDTWHTEARAAVIAVLRELDRTYDENRWRPNNRTAYPCLCDLADRIEKQP